MITFCRLISKNPSITYCLSRWKNGWSCLLGVDSQRESLLLSQLLPAYLNQDTDY